MIGILLPVLTFVAALGTGLIAGLLFAFSAFVMNALARLPPEQGIAAMQSINVAVLNPLFFTVFFGTAVVMRSPGGRCLLQMGRSRRDLSRCWQSALSRRHHCGDDCAQRAAEQLAGGRGAEQCRRCRPVGALRRKLDGLEPCPDGRSPDGIGIVYHRAPIVTPTAVWQRGCAGLDLCHACCMAGNFRSPSKDRGRGGLDRGISRVLAAITRQSQALSGQADARTGKTRVRQGDFAINKWQTLSSPLHWGKGFASAERVSRCLGLPHSDRIDEVTKAVRWLRPGDAFRLVGARA
jgi:hypothetical protein